MRSCALGNESGLIMAGYPAERPEKPFPYFIEVMDGFEYTAAVEMLFDKQIDLGLKTILAIRDRYDGKKRNPLNEPEWGNHYVRSMMAWAGVIAISEFSYSAVDEAMSFTSNDGSYFWSNGYQYGTIEIKTSEGKKLVGITFLNGFIKLRSFRLNGFGELFFKKAKLFEANKTEILEIKR